MVVLINLAMLLLWIRPREPRWMKEPSWMREPWWIKKLRWMVMIRNRSREMAKLKLKRVVMSRWKIRQLSKKRNNQKLKVRAKT